MEFHFILDPSALVYGGIGKLKKWCEVYSNCTPTVIFHIPYYTLNELDFLKKVYNPLISSNARESIRFIDQQVSSMGDSLDTMPSFSDDENDIGLAVSDDDLEEQKKPVLDFETYNRSKPAGKRHQRVKKLSFQLEGENEMGPNWKVTSGYRKSTPLIKDLPNYEENGKVGVYGMKIGGGFGVDPNTKSPFLNDPFAALERNNTIEDEDEDEEEGQYENESRSNMNRKAVVPHNLRKLIRFVVQKQYIDNKLLREEKQINWFVITEEEITETWLKSFGINFINLTTAERLINGTTTMNDVLFKLNESGNGNEIPQVQVREFYNPKTHKLDYMNRSKIKNIDHKDPRVQSMNEPPMLFDPESGELVRADEFKGIKSTFRRSRGSNNRRYKGRS